MSAPTAPRPVLLPHLWQWWLLATAYAALNAGTQWLVSRTADLDQAEQLILGQAWQWGYSSQPPLYTWLVNGLFAFTGPHLAALLLLKVALLSLLAGALLGVGRAFAFSRQQQTVALLGLLFIPQFAWEAQRDLTHSVLATALAAATLWQFVRVQRRPLLAQYALLGLLMGAGLLSKYNYAIFLVALLVAAAVTPGYRRVVTNPRLLLALALALALLAPHAWWALHHAAVAGSSMHKLQAHGGLHLLGAGKALLAAAAFLTPLWLVAWPLLARRPEPRPAAQADDRHFLERLTLVTLAAVLLFTLATGTQEVKDRWYQCLLFYVPLLLACHLRTNPTVWLRRFVVLALLTALGLSLGLCGRTLLAGPLHHVVRPNLPYPDLCRRIAATLPAPPPTTILAPSKLSGGNARPFFPAAQILIPEYPAPPLRPPARLLILRETLAADDDGFAAWVREHYQLDVTTLTFRREELPDYYAPGHTTVLYWATVP